MSGATRRQQQDAWLFLDVKNRGFTTETVSEIWGAVQRLDLQRRVALWAVDAAHYQVLQSAAGGAVQAIWGYMDQDFEDALSAVPFPAPVPPAVQVRTRRLIVSLHRSAYLAMQNTS